MACHRRLLEVRNMGLLSDKVFPYPTTLCRFCLIFRYRYFFASTSLHHLLIEHGVLEGTTVVVFGEDWERGGGELWMMLRV